MWANRFYLQEHVVQWHPTILTKIVLVPQRIMNSYNFDITFSDSKNDNPSKTSSSLFQEGDLLVHFHGCGTGPERDCEKEMKSHYGIWQSEVRRLDGKQSP